MASSLGVLGTLGAMVAKDLRRRRRSPLPTVLQLLFPLIFAGLIALVFGPGEARAPKVHLLLEDRDGGLVAMLIGSALRQEQAAQYFEVETVANVGAGVAELLERKEAAALLRLPAGFSDAVLAGRPAAMELIESPAQSILPKVAEQAASVLAEALSAASRVLHEPLQQLAGRSTAPSDAQVAAIAVLLNQTLRGSQGYLFPPVITLESALRKETGSLGGTAASSSRPSGRTSIFLLMLPGIAVFALFNLADQSMRDLLTEARLKTLRRQLAGPLGAGRVVAGKALATAAVAALSLLSLSLVGGVAWWAGGAGGGVSASGFVLLSFAVVLAATGFSSFLFASARTEKQGATLASLVTLLMAFSGGAFLPSSNLPGALRALAPWSLIHWANEGYQKLILEGAGVLDIARHIGVLAVAGALLLALSGPLWNRRLGRGELV